MKGPKLSDDSKLNYYLLFSMYGHLGFIILAIVISVLSFPWGTKSNLKLIESAVRVDIVAMPKMTLKELQNMEIRPTPTDEGPGAIKAEEKIPEIPSEGPTFLKEKKKEDFLSMLKDVSKKKLKGNDTTKNSKIKNEELEKLILAGNKLSQGSALTGNQATAAEGAFIQYLQGLPDWVRPHWRLPSYLLSLDLKCAIRIYLNPQGLLLKAIVYESSGNQEYDDLALEAVKSSTPFPAPNDEIKNKLLQGEVLLGFPL